MHKVDSYCFMETDKYMKISDSYCQNVDFVAYEKKICQHQTYNFEIYEDFKLLVFIYILPKLWNMKNDTNTAIKIGPKLIILYVLRTQGFQLESSKSFVSNKQTKINSNVGNIHVKAKFVFSWFSFKWSGGPLCYIVTCNR